MHILFNRFKRQKLATNMVLSYVVLSLLVAAGLSIPLYLLESQRLLGDIQQRLLDDSALIANHIDGDQLDTLQTSQDAATPVYQTLLGQLRDEMKALPGVTDVYTVRGIAGEQIAFIVDADLEEPGKPGDIYASPSPALASHIHDIQAPIVENKPYTDEYGSWLSAYAPVFTSGGKIAGLVGVDISASSILEEQKKIALISLLIFCLTIPFAWIAGTIMARYVAKPIQELTGVARKIAEVDLAALNNALNEIASGNLNLPTLQVQAFELSFKRQDEIGRLGESFNHMVRFLAAVDRMFGQMTDNLRDLVGEVSDKVTSVNSTSAQFAAMSAEVNTSVESISSSISSFTESFIEQEKLSDNTLISVEQLKRTIQDVALGAQEQARAVGEAAQMSAQINTAIQHIVSTVETTNQTSLRAADTVAEGTRTVNATIDGMKLIKAKVDESTGKVHTMGEHSEKIGQMVEAIEEISAQTNLLSLNAAIEAARAGDSGKGFAVVADEVRKLAEKSARSAHEIALLVKDIRKTVTEAISSMEAGASEVDKGVALVDQSGRVLTAILSSVEAVKSETAGMSDVARQVSSSVNALSDAMNTVNDVVEGNMAATEQMAAASTDVTDAIHVMVKDSQGNLATAGQVMEPVQSMARRSSDLNHTAQELAGMAEAMQAAADRFTA